MYILFLDDSMQPPVSRDNGGAKLSALGGIVCQADQLKFLECKVQKVKARYRFPHDEEMKWSPKRNHWMRNNLTGSDRENFQKEILNATIDTGSKALVSVIDTETIEIEEAIKKHIEFLSERFQMFLQSVDDYGIIISDQPSSNQEDEKMICDSHMFHTKGTQFIETLDRVVLPIMTAQSNMIVQLQIADLVIGITCAMVAGRQTYAAPLFPTIKDMLHCKNNGEIKGCGLKLYPSALEERYNILFDDASDIDFDLDD